MQGKLMRALALGVMALLLGGSAGGGAAQGPPAAGPGAGGTRTEGGGRTDAPDAEKKRKERRVRIEAPNGTLDYDEKTRTYIITNATMELPDSDAVLTAGRLEFNDAERWAIATGKPRVWDKQSEITADTLRADLKAKRVDAEGSVRMVARPKEAKSETGQRARNRMKEPVIVHCDRAQYFYKDKRGSAGGNLKLTQKDSKADRTATAERLLYDGNDDTVVLEGSVDVSNTRGEGFRCKRLTLFIKDGGEGFRIEGPENVTLFVKEDEEEKSEAKPQNGSGAAGNGQKPPASPPGNGGKAAP